MNFTKHKALLKAVAEEANSKDHFEDLIYRVTEYESLLRHIDQPEGRNGDKIIESIINNGYNPIPAAVKKKYVNGVEMLTLIDGHRRLDACRKLGLPFYYYLVEYDLDDATIRTVNTTPVKWDAIGIASMYARQGKPFYQEFLDLVRGYEMPTSVALYIMTKSTSKKAFDKGILDTFTVVNYDSIAIFLHDLIRKSPRFKNVWAQRAIINSIYSESLDGLTRLKNKLVDNAYKFPVKQGWSQGDYTLLIDELLRS